MGDPAGEVHAGGDPPSCREASIVSFNGPSPPMSMEVLSAAGDGGEGLGKVLDAFFPAQSADVADGLERLDRGVVTEKVLRS